MNRNTANLWLGIIRVLMIAAIPTPRAKRTIVGALLGSIGGGLILGTVGYLTTQCDCSELGIGILARPILGVPIGCVLGGIIGFAKPRERWEPVSVRDSVDPRVQ